MDSTIIIANALLAALALVMFGLGLSLTVQDFTRVLKLPRAVAIALAIQVLGLPLACFFIVEAFGLSPVFAIGMMLLAASPGGITANMFSHLFGGNVAMNITLTAVNTIVAIVTIPLIANLAIGYFADGNQVVPMQFRKVVEVIAIVLIPVGLGMLVGAVRPRFRALMERPVKVFSAVVLVTVIVLSFAKEWSSITTSFAQLGLPVLLFNLSSLLAGYYLSRWAGLDRSLSTAVSFEVGIHNSTLAIYLAVGVLGSFELALPTAVYSLVMYVTAPIFGVWLTRSGRQQEVVVEALEER
ncbi:transporter [Mesorhizobium sp. L-8-10]|uniref:bile acid:sodium symporter family protein n=1 Tax=Mesorhizobium sp. L-8-10 TaxID=2744523 RepID=UPI00193838EC|nr:bile acid:sodium symporter family protein [Mesorhizobium sp. L-8-10]BCH35776.1 transporter [Mesorhizobium sp. L-8-10]